MAAVASLSSSKFTNVSFIQTSKCQVSGLKALPMGVRRPRGIRCQVEPTSEGPSTPSPSPSPSTPEVSPAIPKVESTPKAASGFMDVFAFGGLGPETINGRLAMVGFVSCIAVELATGAPLTRQLADRASFLSFLCTVGLFSVASLVPLFKGITPASRSGGFFTAKAEVWNGRLAMMGLAALAVTEYVKGAALV